LAVIGGFLPFYFDDLKLCPSSADDHLNSRNVDEFFVMLNQSFKP